MLNSLPSITRFFWFWFEYLTLSFLPWLSMVRNFWGGKMSISGAHCAKRGESAGDRTLEPPILCCAHRIGHQCLYFFRWKWRTRKLKVEGWWTWWHFDRDHIIFLKTSLFLMKKGWMVQQPASPVEEYPLVRGFHSLQMITCMTEHRNDMTNYYLINGMITRKLAWTWKDFPASGTNHCGAAVLTGGLPNIIAVSGLQHCNIDITWGFWFVRGLAQNFGPYFLEQEIAPIFFWENLILYGSHDLKLL